MKSYFCIGSSSSFFFFFCFHKKIKKGPIAFAVGASGVVWTFLVVS